MDFAIIDYGKILYVICAGGDGTRIDPLSRFRAKPAIPIGGHNRLIDIPVSNGLNSGLTRQYVIVQRLPHSLIRHLTGYSNGVAQMRGQFVEVLTPSKVEDRFFMSDGDSLLLSRKNLEAEKPEIVIVVMADQIVRVDFRQVIARMLATRADAVMVYLTVPIADAKGRLGVIEINSSGQVVGMEEKPLEPKPAQSGGTTCHGNLAMYAFRQPLFSQMLDYLGTQKPETPLSQSGIPWLIANHRVVAYDLRENNVPGTTVEERGYFADVGTVDAWYLAQMAMCARNPVFNFYSKAWPILTAPTWPMSPAKFDEMQVVNQALCGPNVICQDRVTIVRSVIATGALVGHHSVVEESVVLDDGTIGHHCRLSRVVLDKDIVVPDGSVLSPDHPPAGTIPFAELYRKIRAREPVANVPVLSEGGILTFPKGYGFV